MSAEHGEKAKPCIFCSIVEGKSDCNLIAETEKSMAIMSLEGNPLVLPKKHVDQSNIKDSLSDMVDVYTLANKLEAAIKEAYGVSAVNLLENRGKDAGQEISHYHMHIMPRKKGDKLLTIRHKKMELEGREEIAESLRKLFACKM